AKTIANAQPAQVTQTVVQSVQGYETQQPPAQERQSTTQSMIASVLPRRIEIPSPSLSLPRLDPGRYSPPLDPPRIRPRRNITCGRKYPPNTNKPKLFTSQGIARPHQRRDPPLLRGAGIGGTTILWFLIDERRTVQKKQIFRPSGHRE